MAKLIIISHATALKNRASDTLQAKVGYTALLALTHYLAFFAGSMSHSADWSDFQQRAMTFLGTAAAASAAGWGWSERKFSKRFEELKDNNLLIAEELAIISHKSDRLEKEVEECTEDRRELRAEMEELKKIVGVRNLTREE